MFTQLLKAFQSASSAVASFKTEKVTQLLTDLRGVLRGDANQHIRLYADRGGGMGQQAAAIRILDRLIAPSNDTVPGFDYTGGSRLVEIVYDNDAETTVTNLRKLLEWNTDQNSGTYGPHGNTVDVNLIPVSAIDSSYPWVNFGFSGATDSTSDYPSRIHVHYFLRLQPFQYTSPDQVQYKTSTTSDTVTIDLTDVKDLGKSTFAYRGLYIPLSQNIDWNHFTQGQHWTQNQKDKAQILETLVQNQTHQNNRHYNLLFTYGIHTTTAPNGDPRPNAISTDPFAQAFTLTTGVMASQVGAAFRVTGNLPAIIVNFDNFQIDPNAPYTYPNNNPFDPVIHLLEGGNTNDERNRGVGVEEDSSSSSSSQPSQPSELTRKFQRLYDYRRNYLQRISAADRYYFSTDLQPNQVQTLINDFLNTHDTSKWNITDINQRVLWIQLGPIPPALFNSLLRHSTLPSVFEGNNTANVAVNIPRMYYHIARRGNSNILYPSTILASQPASEITTSLQTAANQMAVLFNEWPDNGEYQNYPPELFATPIKFNRQRTPREGYDRYFQDVADFYTDPANDKLSLALAYLYQQVQANPVTDTVELFAAEDSDPLPDLYDKIQANLKDGILSLIPGAITQGTIYNFLSELVNKATGKAFKLTDATLKRTPESGDSITSITASGNLDAFGDEIPLTLKFTSEKGKLLTAVTFSFGKQLFFDGMDWIPLQEADLTLWVGEDFSIPRGQLEATVTEDINVILQLPSAQGNVLIEGVFGDNGNGKSPAGDTNYPSIGKFFSMAGGINLVNSMPPPLNVLTDLGLAKVEIGLNQTEKKVEFITFLLKTNSSDPLPLFGDVSLDDFSVNVSIQSPGDTKNRTVKTAIDGDFWIGPANQDNSGYVQVGARTPEFTFNAELKKGKIQLTEFIKLFIPDIDIPTSSQTPSITKFSFSYNHAKKSTSISIDLGIYMAIEVAGISPIKIEDIGLSVNRESSGNGKNGNGKEASRSTTTGNLTGNFILFPKSDNPLGLSLIADYGGSDIGWTFKAEQTSGEIKLFELVSRVLGDAFEPPSSDLTFNKLKAEIQPQLGAYKFSGQTANPWHIDFLGLDISGSFQLEYRKKKNGSPKTTLSASTVLPATPVEPWSPPRPAIPVGPLSHRGRAALKRTQMRRGHVLQLPVNGSQLAASNGDSEGLSGTITANVEWENIELDVHYSFKKPTGKSTDHEIEIDLLLDKTKVANAVIKQNDKKQYTCEFKFTSDSVGGLVETFVSWATGSRFSLAAPWNLLDHIPLNNFSIDFNFATKEVSFGLDIGPINLGLATIKKISLEYTSVDSGNGSSETNTNQPKKVQITLEGEFIWMKGQGTKVDPQTGAEQSDKKLSWNAADPSQTPAPPGGGNKYFDLRMLMIGQQVSFSGTETIKTVKQLIDDIDNLSPPKGNQLPLPLVSDKDPKVKLDFDSSAGWLVGADFSILKLGDEEAKKSKQNYLLSLSIVFNDPKLYALRIALAGKAAKIFDGLQFEIMYQQISKTVGVYRTRIALPFQMRTFSAGACTITLPEFGIGIYTNGDFEVDLGFPWNEDFSVSFTLQVIVYGIPVMGSIGLYFAKLSNVTRNQLPAGTSVPNATNGSFNPIIAFGVGAQLGLGYTFNAGILYAGFSLTAFGIVQGVIAKWHPYDGSDYGTTGNDQLDGQYYFQLVGTFGIIGRLFGKVDFGIISAELNVDIKIYAQITYQTYAPILLTASAEVSVSLKVSINLGLFSIHISFHFSAHIKHTFTLEVSNTDAPWHVEQADSLAMVGERAADGLLGGPAVARLYSYRSRNGRMSMLRSDASITPQWDNLKPVMDSSNNIVTLPLKGLFTPALAATGDGAKEETQQQVCYVALLSIYGPETKDNLTDAKMLASDNNTNSDFETLCELIAKWACAAIQDQSYTRDTIENVVVTETGLKDLKDYLAQSTANDPIPADKINSFLNNQVELTLSVPDTTSSGNANAVIIPVPSALQLDTPTINGQAGVSYTFGGFNSTNTDFLQQIRDLFKKLRVDVQQNGSNNNGKSLLSAKTDGGPSVTEFVFDNYFVLLMQQIIQLMLNGLRDFHWSIKDDQGNQTVQDILKTINQAANPPEGQTSQSGVTQVTVLPSDLFVANATHPLGAVVHVANAKLNTRSDNSFDDLAKGAFGAPDSQPYFDGQALALNNSETKGILQTGETVTYPKSNGSSYTINDGDTLKSVADHFNVSVDKLVDPANSDILSQQKLLVPLQKLVAPDFDYTPPTDGSENLQILAGRFGLDVADFAAGDNNPNITQTKGFFSNQGENNDYLHVPHLPQFQVGSLIDEARRVLGLQNLAGMASRFLLHGLRLPVADVNPKAAGLFIEGDEKSGFNYQKGISDLGLYALTGQEVALPANLAKDSGYYLKLSWTDSQSTWLKFDGGKESLSYNVDNQTLVDHITSIQNYIQKNVLNTDIKQIGQNEPFKIIPTRYAIRSKIAWTSSGPPAFPSDQKAPPSGIPLNILSFPLNLTNLQAQQMRLKNGTNGDNYINRTIAPQFTLKTVRYDESTGGTKENVIDRQGFGSFINFTIKKITENPSSPSSVDTYEIVGASTEDIVILERLLNAIQSDDDQITSLTLMYPTDAQSSVDDGVLSDPVDSVYMGIARVNMSTVTRPPTQASLEPLATTKDESTLYNTKTEFLRFLWEASITRSGGFYLYYYNSQSGTGLPDAIFNDNHEAHIALLTLYPFNGDAQAGQPIPSYVNCAAVGEGLSGKDMAVVAESVEKKYTFTLSGSETPEQVGFQYYRTPGDVAVAASTLQLADKAPITVTSGVYQIPIGGGRPGRTVDSLASYFNTQPDALKNANPRISDETWKNLPDLYAIRLPKIEIQASSTTGGTTLQDIATYYGTSIEALGADNRAVPLFAATQSITINSGPVSKNATEPAGVVGYQVVRKAADEEQDFDAENYLLHAYSMLGYQVVANQDFISSNQGLPAGPENTTSEGEGKLRIAKVQDQDNWTYTRDVPTYNFLPSNGSVTAGLLEDATSTSPYKALGRLLQVNFNWQDIYGNRMLTNLSQNSAGTGWSNQTPILTGYHDPLFGVGKWPSINTTYEITGPGGGQDATLSLFFSFSTSRYLQEDNNKNLKPNPLNARNDISRFNQVLQQLNDPAGITIGVDTSLLTSQPPLTIDPVKDLTEWILQIIQFLQKVADGNTPTPDPSLLQHPWTLTLSHSALTTSQINEITVSISIQRNAEYVQGPFKSTPGIASAITQVAPYLAKKDNGTAADDTQPLTLKEFAQAFETALSDQQTQVKLATGVDRFKLTGQNNGDALWAVRLSKNQDVNAGMWINIENPTSPVIYSARPISKTLISRKDVNIWTYKTGESLDLTGSDFSKSVFTNIDVDRWMQTFLEAVDRYLSPSYTSPTLILQNIMGQTGDETYLNKITELKKSIAGNLSSLLTPVLKGQSANDTQKSSAQETYKQALLERLSNAYAPSAVLQFPAQVGAQISEPEMNDQEPLTPQLYGPIEKNSSTQSTQDKGKQTESITLSSPKIPLTTTSKDKPAQLTTLLTAHISDNTPTSAGSDSGTVTVQGSYQGSNIEHQIGLLKDIQDYHASSWLEFVIPLNDNSSSSQTDTTTNPSYFNGQIGPVTVPLVLRAYPSTPNMQSQAQDIQNQGNVSLTDNGHSLYEIRRWKYKYTYSQDYHYPQDFVTGSTTFNHRVALGLMDALETQPDLFDTLAEFTTQYPAIEKDLNSYLQNINGISSQSDDTKNAWAALESLYTLINYVADSLNNSSWIRPDRNMLTAMDPQSAQPFAYTIIEIGGPIEGLHEDALIVSIVGNLPAGISTPTVEIDGYTSETYQLDETLKEKFQNILKSLDLPLTTTINAYSFFNTDTNPKNWLTLNAGRAIPARSLIIPIDDVLVRQNAQSSLKTVRNKEINGIEIADPFVYETAEVSFTNPLTPGVFRRGLDIAQVGGDKPATRTIEDHLANLFDNLFAQDAPAVNTLQMTTTYSYSINEISNVVSLPILFLAPLKTDRSADAKDDGDTKPLSDTIKTIASGIDQWFKDNKVPSNGGVFWFDLTILTNLTEKPSPLLTIDNMNLDIKYVDFS